MTSESVMPATSKSHYGPGNAAPNNMGANFTFNVSNSVDVITYDANNGDDSFDNAFMFFVY